eukprot:NODE_3613_length_2010_cov_22.537440.p1 GENE.NODE_3613_length_2010_cov_22.537440~~NODE_3613_length_2010_cov_22.537440.p1  ORF type:complete len:585 (+),score=51.31 NODE_3613_length_2010_cov_22.537440:88-1755(+)
MPRPENDACDAMACVTEDDALHQEDVRCGSPATCRHVEVVLERHHLQLEERFDRLEQRLSQWMALQETGTRDHCFSPKPRATDEARPSDVMLEQSMKHPGVSTRTAIRASTQSVKKAVDLMQDIHARRNQIAEQLTREHHPVKTQSWRLRFKAIYCSRFYQPCVTVSVLLYTIVLGLQTHWMSQSPGANLPTHLNVLDRALFGFMAADFMLRVVTYGPQVMVISGVLPASIDTLVVVAGAAEIVITAITRGGGVWRYQGVRTLRCIRVCQILKVVRTARLTSALRAFHSLVAPVIAAAEVLMWSGMFFALIIYLFALLFTEAYLAALCHSRSCTEDLGEETVLYWGSLTSSMSTLFQSVLGGMDWGSVENSLTELGDFWFALFYCYITFFGFAVFNSITAAFVQSAADFASTDPDTLIFNNVKAKEQLREKLTSLFNLMSRGAESLTLPDFLTWHHDECIHAYFTGLGIETGDSGRLFNLIDKDGDDCISRDEFVDACLDLRGSPRCLSMAFLSSQVEDMQLEFKNLMRYVTASDALMPNDSCTWTVAASASDRD